MQKKKLASIATDEIENYLSTPRLNSIKSDPLNSWKENKEIYPQLTDIALLAVPSSTTSERGLLISGRFITKDCSSLANKKAAKLVQLWSSERL
jgi:hypothetical protein